MIKLITIDLDGTLFDDKKNISEENIKAIKECKEKGIHVVIATGRPFNGTLEVLKTLDLLGNDDYLICYNGCKVINCGTKELIFESSINGRDVKDLYNESLKHNIDIHAFRENEELITKKHNPYTDVETRINHITDIEYDFTKIGDDEKFLKAMLVGEKEHLDQIEKDIDERFKTDLCMIRSSKIFLEFINPSSNKGLALEALAKYLNIANDETMAIGDAGNDLSMITKAHIGVAMANAFPYVLEEADYITDDNEHSGVAKAIYKFTKQR